MSSIYARGLRLWMRVRDHGKWTSRRTPYAVGQESDAERYAARVQERLNARPVDAQPDADTVEGYALGPWIDARREAGDDWSSDRGRLAKHVLPVIGALKLEDVRPKHIADVVRRMRFHAELAPRTVRNVYFVARAMFRDAAIDGRLGSNPCILTAAQLGGVVDSDPEWRAGALFTRPETEALISDSRIPFDRRVVYGLGLLAGLRPGEGAALRLRHYDATITPLGRLLVATAYSTDRSALKRTKTEAVRAIPVHPALAELLATWIRAGWAAMVGRDPGPDDLLVPLPPETATRRTKRTGEPFRGWDYTGRRWREEDLPMLGWRARSVYDTRATFISLAVEDGADEQILRDRVTHTKARDAFGGYNRLGPKWEETCAEVAKLRIVTANGAPKPAFFDPSIGQTASDYEHVTVLLNSPAAAGPGPLATPLLQAAQPGAETQHSGSGGGSRTPDDTSMDRDGSCHSDEDMAPIMTDHDRSMGPLVAIALLQRLGPRSAAPVRASATERRSRR